MEYNAVAAVPVKWDRKQKMSVLAYTRRNWTCKLAEEVSEFCQAMDEMDRKHAAEELADMMTVCMSWGTAMGITLEELNEAQARVNEKNFCRQAHIEHEEG